MGRYASGRHGLLLLPIQSLETGGDRTTRSPSHGHCSFVSRVPVDLLISERQVRRKLGVVDFVKARLEAKFGPGLSDSENRSTFQDSFSAIVFHRSTLPTMSMVPALSFGMLCTLMSTEGTCDSALALKSLALEK